MNRLQLIEWLLDEAEVSGGEIWLGSERERWCELYDLASELGSAKSEPAWVKAMREKVNGKQG